jgi:HEPN domain-containing protein
MHDHSSFGVFLLSQMLRTTVVFVEGDKELDANNPTLRTQLKHICEGCEETGLVVSAYLANRLVKLIEKMNPPISRKHFLEQINSIINSIEAELTTITFFRITIEEARYYKDKQLFGAEVEEKFKKAIQDIEEAGKCLALSRSTAAVFHLVRVMEVGLKSLGRALSIPYAPSWESYIKQIGDKIAEKHKLKGIKWKRDEPFFRDILGDLQTIKIAWRNPTMHIVRHYNPEEAEEIFRAVRGFMKRLATRFSDAS